ncbi:MAG: EamA family transporter [Bdellovibrionota bacterium]
MLGITLLVGVFETHANLNPNFTWGVIFGLLTGPFYAGFVFCTRQIQTLSGSPSTKTCLCIILGIAALFAACFAWLEGANFSHFRQQWPLYMILALVSQVIGWFLISANLTKVPLALSGLILLLQPVLAFVLGIFLFREHASILQMTGGMITLIAIYFTTARIR